MSDYLNPTVLLEFPCTRRHAMWKIFIILWLDLYTTWWCHQMETFSALLAIYVGNSPVTGEFPTQRPVSRSFDIFFDLHLNKRLSKQTWVWWFEMLLHPLWCNFNEWQIIGLHFSRYFVQVLTSTVLTKSVGIYLGNKSLASSVYSVKEFTVVALHKRMLLSDMSILIVTHTTEHVYHNYVICCLCWI